MFMEAAITVFFALTGTAIASCKLVRDPARILAIPVASSLLSVLFSLVLAFLFFTGGPVTAFRSNLLLDALSLYHIFLVTIVFLCSSLYATGYFQHRISEGAITVAYARRYSMLWQTFQAILMLVLLSNNIGLMWIAIEATTLVSAFLIISDSDPLSIEAMWKYLLICSVGIAFAFMGTLLTIAAARKMEGIDSVHLFSSLIRHPELIDPKIMLLAFILMVVGFGTKAGLAPMHTWLPDAHSQAPTPVSSVFSGVMLNCALFCIMRYLPVTEAALGHDGQARSILLLFGFISMIFAAVFIPVQFDMKRLLAYHSVEHLGIIAVGLGIGGFGTFAALLHTTNHSLSKILAFFAAGHIGDRYGTRDMRQISSAVRCMPWWGTAFLVAILVLIGVAPFSVFMSEFLIAKEAFFTGKYAVFILFVFTALAVFISALKHALDVSFGDSHPAAPGRAEKAGIFDKGVIVFCVVMLLLLGLWIPSFFADFIMNAAAIVEKGAAL